MNKDNLNFSVVLPIHNDEQWLMQALGSIEQQIMQPREVIAVVDSSTDRSLAIVTNHPAVTDVLQSNARNAAVTRNLGVERASSEWIAFLDADDWWHPKHLSEASDMLAATRDVAYMSNFREYFQKDERFLERKPLDVVPGSGLSDRDFYRLFLGDNPGWPTVGMIISRHRFRQAGGFDPSQIRRHDTEMFARIVYGHTWAYNANSRFTYRKDVSTSISSAIAECTYYRLLADKKISDLFGRQEAAQHMKRKATICLGAVYRESDRSLQKKSWQLARPYLDPKEKILFTLANLSLLGTQAVYRLIDRKKSKAQRQEEARNIQLENN